jgi:hypothetical protein
VGLVGSRCSLGGNETGINEGCVENAECLTRHPKLTGACKCLVGFAPGPDRLCADLRSNEVETEESSLETSDEPSNNSTTTILPDDVDTVNINKDSVQLVDE